jgi:hypothetical protein
MGLHCEIDPSATIVRLAEKEKARAGLLGSAAAAGPFGQLPPAARAAMELLTTPCRNQNLNDEAGLGESGSGMRGRSSAATLGFLDCPISLGQYNEPSNVRLAGIPKNRKWMAMAILADTPAIYLARNLPRRDA